MPDNKTNHDHGSDDGSLFGCLDCAGVGGEEKKKTTKELRSGDDGGDGKGLVTTVACLAIEAQRS